LTYALTNNGYNNIYCLESSDSDDCCDDELDTTDENNQPEMDNNRLKGKSKSCSSAKLNSAKLAHFDPPIREIKFRENFFP